jgi:hypothetical protein
VFNTPKVFNTVRLLAIGASTTTSVARTAATVVPCTPHETRAECALIRFAEEAKYRPAAAGLTAVALARLNPEVAP